MKVMLIAGEVSGDMRAAEIIRTWQSDTTVQCFGIGGRLMQEAGCEIIVDAKQLAVMGIIDIIRSFFVLRHAWKTAKKALIDRKPNVLVLIDYPGFNLRFAKWAKKHGTKVVYYISPKIWAWKSGRIKIIQRAVDHMIVIFPFERLIYEKAGVKVSDVGHPLIDQLNPLSKEAAKEQLHLRDKTIVALVPGSRRAELTRLMPVLMESACLLKEAIPALHFVLPIADNFSAQDMAPFLRPALAIELIQNKTPLVLNAASLVIGASGTVTLEAAILGTPMVILYKTDWLTFFIGRRVVKIPFIGLPNILAGHRILPELIQKAANADNITHAALSFLTDAKKMAVTLTELAHLRAGLGKPGVAARVAKIIREEAV